jgi:hypothetical protein
MAQRRSAWTAIARTQSYRAQWRPDQVNVTSSLGGLEADTGADDHVVGDNGIIGYGELITGADDQIFSAGGTGIVLRAVYGSRGGLHTGPVASQNEQIAGHQSGLNAYAQAPGPSGTSSFHRCNPSLTGGGSAGYNSMYSQDGSAQTLAH